MASVTHDTALHRYIEVDEGYYLAYEAYQPDVAVIEQIGAIQPTAHVIIPSRYSCSDCARNIPAMARIAEHLPGWTWDIFDSRENPERREQLAITHVPTFIVTDYEGGSELGRIVENPTTGSLEQDLLQIVRAASEGRKN